MGSRTLERRALGCPRCCLPIHTRTQPRTLCTRHPGSFLPLCCRTFLVHSRRWSRKGCSTHHVGTPSPPAWGWWSRWSIDTLGDTCCKTPLPRSCRTQWSKLLGRRPLKGMSSQQDRRCSLSAQRGCKCPRGNCGNPRRGVGSSFPQGKGHSSDPRELKCTPRCTSPLRLSLWIHT